MTNDGSEVFFFLKYFRFYDTYTHTRAHAHIHAQYNTRFFQRHAGLSIICNKSIA